MTVQRTNAKKCHYYVYNGCRNPENKQHGIGHKCPEGTDVFCQIRLKRKPKIKQVFMWTFLDSKKGDRLAEVIREALEKHGEVTITIE